MTCPRCKDSMLMTHRVERESLGPLTLVKVVQLNECLGCQAEVVIIMLQLLPKIVQG